MARTYFFWDPLSDNILQERDETGTVTAEYTTEPGLYGNLISQNRGGVESQPHFDALGSTLALTDDDQQVTDTWSYTAFGEVTEHTGSTVNPFQYVGQKGYYKNDLTGEYFVRRRPCLPAAGRWTSPDPLGFVELQCIYMYTFNNPQGIVDPSGLMAISLRSDPGSRALFPCSGYMAKWLFLAFKDPRDVEIWKRQTNVVQRICIYEDVNVLYCEPPCCTPTYEVRANGCCIYEWLTGAPRRLVDLRTGRYALVDDTNSIPAITPWHRCTTSGSFTVTADVRAFRNSPDVQRELEAWEKPRKSCPLKGIGDIPIEGVNPHVLDEPDFWNKAAELIDKGSHTTHVAWDCCSPWPCGIEMTITHSWGDPKELERELWHYCEDATPPFARQRFLPGGD